MHTYVHHQHSHEHTRTLTPSYTHTPTRTDTPTDTHVRTRVSTHLLALAPLLTHTHVCTRVSAYLLARSLSTLTPTHTRAYSNTHTFPPPLRCALLSDPRRRLSPGPAVPRIPTGPRPGALRLSVTTSSRGSPFPVGVRSHRSPRVPPGLPAGVRVTPRLRRDPNRDDLSGVKESLGAKTQVQGELGLAKVDGSFMEEYRPYNEVCACRKTFLGGTCRPYH